MAFQLVPNKVLLKILIYVTPHELALCTSLSRDFHHLIKAHETYLCRQIAEACSIHNSKVTAVTTSSPIQELCMQWGRSRVKRQLLSKTEIGSQTTDDDLDLLWAYYDSRNVQDGVASAENYRRFIQSASEHLVDRMIRTAGDLVAVILGTIDSWMTMDLNLGVDGQRVENPCFQIVFEMVLVKGLKFVAKVITGSSDCQMKMLAWIDQHPRHRTTSVQLYEERRWKRKTSWLQANAVEHLE
ncbi:hypothetical protein MMC09_003284 [Bachmanniomyces sp. S44760]|nr:hypothetical protein [Bachmanniomyces sp. S44760]